MLAVDSISFSYANKPILKDVSFSIEKGTHLSIMGESGSGKSTLLKAIYGLLELEKGTVFWGKEQVLGPNYNLVPGEKYMKYVAQDFDLMPFTTVTENIAEHLSAFEMDSHQARITELLHIIEMEEFAHVKVKNLSGGQQQRVALARALAQEPEVLLLDEPFSSIDQFKKNELRYKLFPYLREKGITVINASHDPNDVLAFADETIVLKNGEILAHEPTVQLYQIPKEKYVASLFGVVNKVPITLLKEYSETDKSILIYPHEFMISPNQGFEVYVVNNHFKGSHYLIQGLSNTGFSVFFTNRNALQVNTQVFLNVSLQLVNKRLNP
ncbi:Putative iron-uptake ABC transport system ATP-binding protein [Croceitalea dokdonensis DOKDO 023]|uniref:Putative iron-uptake ABC transport system ATP-binding protein n=1 Tax=Croceitalea dokdonensis DOKDO 023 TaxID=1300341 RepID=A0A0P7AWV8_9FLAO|nr:ABC transporter ATP-binding protein [Croceitalea dokdonensis]KPM30823.1 Putative iron-uptake ABC transport system ATP-binding protein [Croceitalea dokdonensis DOKDO 023]